ncbi:MAG: replication-relaxation family protein [Candidatus Dormibacteria bacterium]
MLTALSGAPPRRLALTPRDEDLVRWVARHGLVSADQVGRRFFPSMWAAWRRLRRLETAGLLRREPAFRDLPFVVRVTGAGARLAACDVLPARLDAGLLRHALAVVDLSEQLVGDAPGAEWITERELRRDRMRAARVHPEERQRRTPDGLLVLPGGRRVAVELDLTPKRTRKLEQLADAYALDASVECVWWFLPSAASAGRMREVIADRGLEHLIETRVRRTEQG